MLDPDGSFFLCPSSDSLAFVQEFTYAPETAKVPLLICHGDADSRARYEWAQQSRQRLAAAGVEDIEFHTYPGMDHTSSPRELQDITAWLQRVLPASSS